MAKYKAYPEYKDSGVEWFDKKPLSWKVTRLKLETIMNMGQSPNSDDYNIEGDGLAFLQGNAEFGKIHPIEKQYCPVAKKVANPGDILFSVRAPVGAINFADKKYGIGRGLCSIAASANVVSPFLWWLLPAYKYQLDAIATGSTFEAVSAEQLGNLSIALPSVSEQRQIAAFLDHETAKIDNLIEKQRQLIKLLKEKRQAVISHAVTKGLNPDVQMKDSGIEWLGEVPAHWAIPSLKYNISTRKGVAFKSSDFCDAGIRVVKASDIKKKTIISSDVFLPVCFSKKYPKAVLNFEDIVLSTVGSTPDVKNSAVGQLGYVPAELEGSLLNQNTVIFTSNSNVLEQFYLFLLLQTDIYRDHLDLHAHGTANQASLNVSDMLDFKYPCPSLSEQIEIIDYIQNSNSKFDALETCSEEAIKYLQERRIALISAAVTGKIDVRDWAAPETQDVEEPQEATA